MAYLRFIGAILFLVHCSACVEDFEERVVYPRFLEARSDGIIKTLKLTDDLILNLEQHSAYGEQLLLRTTTKDGSHFHEYVSTLDYNNMLFQDKATMASVAIAENNGLHVRGMIGDKLRIKPLLTSERSEEGIVPHLLYQEDSSKERATKYDYAPGPLIQEATKSFEGITIEQRSEQAMRPEIHILIDYIYYRRYNFQRNEILLYFGAALNSINLRYSTIQELNIRLCIVGFTFYTDESVEFRFLRRVHGSDYNNMIDTLAAFKEYYKTNEPSLLYSVDILVLVSGRDYCIVHGGRLDCTTGGIAYVAGACTEHRQALIEDRAWSFDIVRSMAHEVGHSLGCVHDGQGPPSRVPNHPGAVDCPRSWGYIMSYDEIDSRQYRFSPCCVRQIQFVSALSQYQCLFKNNSHTEAERSRKLPGFVVSASRLCNITFGHRGYPFVVDWNRQRAECQIPCRSQRPVKGRLHDSGFAKAVDGTNCTVSGSKVCIRGECVDRNRRSNRPSSRTMEPTNGDRGAPRRH